MALSFDNTFEKGMNSDYQVIYQPNGTVRYMKNCQLINQDGNNYAIKDCLGNTVIFTINPPYDAVYTVVGQLPMPLAFISFPNKLIVISTNYNGAIGTAYMEIGKLEYLPYGEGIQYKSVAGQYNPGYIPLYHHLSLNGDLRHQIEGFAFSENELIERIYWTDNNNEPRVFNVSDPIFTTYFTTGSLVVGTQYMVLEGAIQHPVGGANPIYGPGLSAGNVFTAVNANFTDLTTPTPTAKVVLYYAYQLLNWQPSRALGTITFVEYGSGNLYCGNKIYFYRLSNRETQTSWSYGCSPIHTGTVNNPNLGGILPYHNFVGGGTTTALLNSGKSIKVKIENIDTIYDFIEIACAEYDQLIDVPRQITIVNKVAITGATMTIEHNGNSNLGDLTIGDITLFPASILKIKTLTTNKNYNLIANITERAEFDWDLSGINAGQFQYPMNVHSDPTSCSLGGMIYDGAAPVVGANPAATTVTPWSRYLVTVGIAIYNGNNYVVGEVIVGVSGSPTIDVATNPGTQVRPCVTRNKYTSIATGKRVENAIEITGAQGVGFWTYKEPVVHHHCTSYRAGETYRFSIVPFDLKGNPHYAKWAFDYTFPGINLKGGPLRHDTFGAGEMYSLNPSGISITNIVIPPSVMNQISGFAIMRAERDPIIVAQGLVTQCVKNATTPDIYHPASWVKPSLDPRGLVDKLYTYICPDSLVNVPLKYTIGQLGDIMEEACWYDPIDYGGGRVARGSGPVSSEQAYSKIIIYLTDDAIPRSKTITYWGSVEEGDSLTDLGSGNIFDNGNMTTAAANVNVNGACVAGAANYNLNSHNNTGCKKIVFKLDTDFDHYGPPAAPSGYTNPANAAQTQKILMNYIKAGKTIQGLYGGQVDSAKANTLYISTGHFQPITAAVKADTFDGTNYVFNNVEVFGGDCFVNLVDIGYGLWDNVIAPTFSYAWTFPCENDSNYDLRRGRKTSNVEMFFTGTVNADCIVYQPAIGDVRLEDYSYNQGYSAEGQTIVYPALPVDFVNASIFQSRIRFAGVKFIGELIDSFRTFALLDFKDLSGQNGRINNLKTYQDRVFVWQDWAICTVPVLERQQIVGNTGDTVNIGTGGVVDRFDIVTSYFGNQHQWGVVPTEYGFMWFDMHRKGACVLAFDGMGLAEVSLIGGLQNFFNEVFLEAIGDGSVTLNTNFLNSPTFADTSDRPLMGVGITGVYDPKFKMTYLTFKFKARKSITVNSAPADGYWSKDFTIGYLHTKLDRFFVGFYDWFPAIAHNHNQWVFSCNNPKNTTQYLATSLVGMSFVVGETLQGVNLAGTTTNSEYICIATVTLDNAIKYPLGASGATYWRSINDTNKVYAHNQPALLLTTPAPDYQYNMFYGRVVDNELTVIVNPPQGVDETFYVGNIEQIGQYNVNVTTIATEGNLQTATDANITGTNINYRFIFNKITSSLPLSSTGRIFSNYLKMTFTKRNWTTDPRVITTSVKILQKIRSFFTFHR